MSDHVTITGRKPTQREAQQVLAQLFSEPGEYVIAKATEPMAPAEEWAEWWLQQLTTKAEQHFINAELATWETLERMLHERGVTAPSELAFWELNQALWDMGTANTATMVGIHIPAELSARLHAIGFTPLQTLAFPSLAYRMGKIAETLAAGPVVAWEDVLRQARSFPLSSAERAAVNAAEQRAGLWLRPIFDQSGKVWTAEREIAPLRKILTAGMDQRRSVREMARELGASQRAQGVLRDADRVVATEVSNARSLGAWENDSKRWAADALLFRQPAGNACRGCLRLFLRPDGFPHLYTRQEFEAGEALGVNRGNWREWHLRVQSEHPNCRCGPVRQYHPAMQSILAPRAAQLAADVRELRVFEEQAA